MPTGQVLLKAHSSNCTSVCWSSDDRIAVITDECIYIITLKDALQANAPPVAINVIRIPSSLSFVQSPAKLTDYHYYKLFDKTDSYDVLYDTRITSNVSTVHFISARWSPNGCSNHNRCVLCCLTNTNRILIYHVSTGTQWTIAFDLSNIHYQYLVDCKFTLELEYSSKEKSTLSQLHEYYRQQSLLVATAMSWLPVLLDDSDGNRIAVLAIAWRGQGYISLWSIKVPLNEISEPSLIKTILLHVDNGWISSIEWSYSQTGSLYLSVGCCTGQLMLLEWSRQGDVLEDILIRNEPIVTQICQSNDGMSIDNLAWSLQTDDIRWLLFNKSSYLFGTCVTPSNSPSSPTLLYMSNLPISGITVLHNNDVIYCSRDGTINKGHLPNDTSLIEPHESSLIEHGIKSSECTGIACSKNGLFAVTCFHKMFIAGKRPYQVLLIPLCKANDTSFISQLRTEICSWDLYQYVRHSPELWVESIEPPLPLMIQRQIVLLKGDKERLLSIEKELLIEHSRSYLQHYIKWTTPIKERLSLVSISHNATFLLKESGSVNPSDRLLANKVLSKLSQNIVELCPVCDEGIPYVSNRKGTCSNKHSWVRCVLTQSIVNDLTSTMKCSVCSSKAISHSKTNWLTYVISSFQRCPLCGGYFESLL